mmetsp:Transcript_41154/g.62338  ORF Transcript_41154/g.62338 Transcript_41154/m.62338 type:complete len:312 (-) Transcript_41154:26-961(-)
MADYSSHFPLAEKACKFLTSSPDPYHAVQNMITRLEGVGYARLSKRDPFAGKLEPGGKYYYTVNTTTLIAFAVGPKYKPGNGFKIIGGHTDSPNLKVRPRSQRSAAGCIQLGVDCYGGGLWHTWFDRDLGLSGRVLVREKDGKVVQKLVLINRPIARVSTLCIHLQTAEERRQFTVKKEDHLMPILGTQTLLENAVRNQLNTGSSQLDAADSAWRKEQEPLLLKMIASELGIDVMDIADFELNLFDTQPATLGGITSEFLYAARLDNLATCFVSCEALSDYTESESFQDDGDITLVALFDHEEVGSGKFVC